MAGNDPIAVLITHAHYYPDHKVTRIETGENVGYEGGRNGTRNNFLVIRGDISEYIDSIVVIKPTDQEIIGGVYLVWEMCEA